MLALLLPALALPVAAENDLAATALIQRIVPQQAGEFVTGKLRIAAHMCGGNDSYLRTTIFHCLQISQG